MIRSGATSGNGITVNSQLLGHGISIVGAGVSKYGIAITSGASDGVNITASSGNAIHVAGSHDFVLAGTGIIEKLSAATYTDLLASVATSESLTAAMTTVSTSLQTLIDAAGTLTAAERQAVADVILGRDVANAEAASAVHSLATLILAATNKANTRAHAGKLTVFRTDGVTEQAQIPISTDANAEPIDGVG